MQSCIVFGSAGAFCLSFVVKSDSFKNDPDCDKDDGVCELENNDDDAASKRESEGGGDSEDDSKWVVDSIAADARAVKFDVHNSKESGGMEAVGDESVVVSVEDEKQEVPAVKSGGIMNGDNDDDICVDDDHTVDSEDCVIGPSNGAPVFGKKEGSEAAGLRTQKFFL